MQTATQQALVATAPAPLSAEAREAMAIRNQQRRVECRAKMDAFTERRNRLHAFTFSPLTGVLTLSPALSYVLGLEEGSDEELCILEGRCGCPLMFATRYSRYDYEKAMTQPGRPRVIQLAPRLADDLNRWIEDTVTAGQKPTDDITLSLDGPRGLVAATTYLARPSGPVYFHEIMLPDSPVTDEEFERDHDGYNIEHEATGAQVLLNSGGRSVTIPAATAQLLGLYEGCCATSGDAGETKNGRLIATLGFFFPNERGAPLTGKQTGYVTLPISEKDSRELLEAYPKLATHPTVVTLAGWHEDSRTKTGPRIAGVVPHSGKGAFPAGHEIYWLIKRVKEPKPLMRATAPERELELAA